MQGVRASSQVDRELLVAADKGDYARAFERALALVPNKGTELSRYRALMELYEESRRTADWRRALRALADARAVAIAVELPELERAVTHRLFDLVKEQQEGRKA